MLSSKSQRALIAGVAMLALTACADKGAGTAQGAAADPDAQAMQTGTNLLYQSGDPVGAEAQFRQVLQRTPTHYGARYQLAVALDRGGKPVEARQVWQAVLTNAEQIQDTATAGTARRRLAAPDTASQAGMMALGLDLMNRQNNPTAAADQFRLVLKKNPTHYGATYQLATALDKAGQTATARPIWQKMLGMATAINDTKTMETARARLAGTR